MKSPTLLCLFLFFTEIMLAQTPVFLENPSFEDLPQYASVPGGWRSCAFNGESPPDIHPVKKGRFGVDQIAANGKTYLGLVLRENGTSESVGQHLTEPLRAGQCYRFTMQICRADTLISMGRVSRKTVNFNTPAKLVIWGGASPCGKKFKLAASTLVDHSNWQTFTFHLQPQEDVEWILFEAGFSPDEAYNGNILLDDASPFVPVDCIDNTPLVDIGDYQIPQFLYRKIVVKIPNSEGFFASQGNGRYLVNLRLVQSEATLDGLLNQNCRRVNFYPGTADLTEPLGIGLKEMGVNAEKFGQLLIIGIKAPDERLAKKRKRKVEKIFREVDLANKHFRIEYLGETQAFDWRCGDGEVLMKLEK